MLPRADLNTSRPLASIEAPTPVASSTDARQEVFHRLAQITIGRQLQAEVMSIFDDGTFLVRVADTAARMMLPAGTRVGDTLSMVMVAQQPRPTFLLTEEGSAPSSLSAAARLIDQLVQAADQEGAPAALAGKAPLLPSAAAMDPKLVATALNENVEFSGLFYESHVQEWLSGARPQADLQREPQARFPTAPGGPDTAAAHAQPDLAKLATSLHEVGESENALMNLIRSIHQQSAKLLTVDADVIAHAQAAAPALSPEAARIVNLQLHTLEQQQLRWQGELWPGQRMDWEIREDKDGADGADGKEAQQSSWTSVVRFQLPALGEVTATLRLTGDRVGVSIGTASEDSAAALRARNHLLADALEAAGSPLESFQVKRDETS